MVRIPSSTTASEPRGPGAHSGYGDSVEIAYRIGVDGGGSGTRARLLRASGELLGEGQSGPSNLAQGIEQAWRHVQEAIARAQDAALVTAHAGLAAHAAPSAPATSPTPLQPPLLPSNTALGLGLAGANNPLLHAQFLQANPGYRLIALHSDAYATLLGAHGARAGAIIAVGTGSVGLARWADGHTRTVGGWGFPSGDDGSGALLGLQAMNHSQQVQDGIEPGGPLAQAVLQATGGNAQAMLQWCCEAGQTRFASLAPLVFAHAAHDPAAAALLAQAQACIERMAAALDPEHSLPLALLGSIGRLLAPGLSTALQSRLVAPLGDAMDGALQLCTTPTP